MTTLNFASLADAESHLVAHGFRFVGAPDRWRLHGNRIPIYAVVRRRGDGCIVLILRPGPAKPPIADTTMAIKHPKRPRARIAGRVRRPDRTDAPSHGR